MCIRDRKIPGQNSWKQIILLFGDFSVLQSHLIPALSDLLPLGACLQVKQQHIDNNTQFLADELQVVDRREAKDRVFFVSAREALVSRLQNDSGVPTPGV